MHFSVKPRTVVLFNTEMVPLQLLQFQVMVDLRVMPMKMYSTFLNAQESKSHDQIHFSIKPRTLLLFVP